MQTERSLSTRQQFTFALPMLGVYFLIGPLSLMQGIYATYFGVTLSTMAVVLLTVRLFDAVTDPLIGYISDRQYACSGSRKNFVVSGGILMIFAGYFLFVPADPSSVNASTQVSAIYLLVCYFAFYLSATIIVIPHMAWASEISTTAQEKNNIFAWRVAMISIGSLLFYFVPFLPFFETTEFTPQTLEFTALISAFLIVPSLFLCIRAAPKTRGIAGLENPILSTGVATHLQLAHILGNKPLLLFLLSFVSYGLSAGTFWALSFIFITSYLDMGAHYALVAVLNMISGLLFIKVWVLVAEKIRRKFVWALGLSLVVIGTLLMVVLEPGEGNLSLLLIAYMIVGAGLVAGEVIAPVILSDIIDYHQWKFKADCCAGIYSLFMLSTKINFAIGGALAFFIAGWYGFDPSVAESSAEAIFGLRLAAIGLPVFFGLIAIIFVLRIPITKHRHNVIRRRLDDRVLRAGRAQQARIEQDQNSNSLLLEPTS